MNTSLPGAHVPCFTDEPRWLKPERTNAGTRHGSGFPRREGAIPLLHRSSLWSPQNPQPSPCPCAGRRGPAKDQDLEGLLLLMGLPRESPRTQQTQTIPAQRGSRPRVAGPDSNTGDPTPSPGPPCSPTGPRASHCSLQASVSPSTIWDHLGARTTMERGLGGSV